MVPESTKRATFKKTVLPKLKKLIQCCISSKSYIPRFATCPKQSFAAVITGIQLVILASTHNTSFLEHLVGLVPQNSNDCILSVP